jgi:hypothetical protein
MNKAHTYLLTSLPLYPVAVNLMQKGGIMYHFQRLNTHLSINKAGFSIIIMMVNTFFQYCMQ